MNKTITHALTFKAFKKRKTIICFMKKEQKAMHLVAIEQKVEFYLLTYGFNIKRKKYKRKERSIRSINSLKLIKRV